MNDGFTEIDTDVLTRPAHNLETLFRKGLVNSYLNERVLWGYDCIDLASHGLTLFVYHCANGQLFVLALDLNSNHGQKIEANAAIELLP